MKLLSARVRERGTFVARRNKLPAKLAGACADRTTRATTGGCPHDEAFVATERAANTRTRRVAHRPCSRLLGENTSMQGTTHVRHYFGVPNSAPVGDIVAAGFF